MKQSAKFLSVLATGLSAAFLLSACSGEAPQAPAPDKTQTAQPAPAPESEPAPDLDRETRFNQMLAAVKTVSVAAAASDAAMAEELRQAKTQTQDSLTEDNFLKMVFEVTTAAGTKRSVTALGYCEEYEGRRDYQAACSEFVRSKLAVTNGVYSSPLEVHVPTNNPAIRENALVSVRWLRDSLDHFPTKDTLYLVTEIKDPAP